MIIVPVNTGLLTNVVLMLDQRRRRWANIKTALVKSPVFAGVDAISRIHSSTFRAKGTRVFLCDLQIV